jgi:hypothetical protein
VLDHGFDLRSAKPKTIKVKTGICCLSSNHAALMRMSKDWVVLNQDNMSEWRDVSTQRLVGSESG